MRQITITTLFVLSAALVVAAGWNKPYFAGTQPGSWAKYAQKASVGPDSTATMTRLADEGGRVRIEERDEFADKVTPPSTTVYEMAPGFDVARDLIDYPKALVAASSAANKEALAPMPAAAVASMKQVMSQYAPTAVFKATETVGGKSCDHYTYTIKGATIETGDLWLSDAVPFGIVKKVSTTKDGAGKVLVTAEQTLVDSGTKSLPKTTQAAPAPTSFTLKQAYETGLVDVSIEIDPAVKDGARARLVVESREKTFTLTVPAGKTVLAMSLPIDEFIFQPAGAQRFELSPDRPAHLIVTQLGEHRVMSGKFQVGMSSQGKPMFIGSAKAGWVK